MMFDVDLSLRLALPEMVKDLDEFLKSKGWIIERNNPIKEGMGKTMKTIKLESTDDVGLSVYTKIDINNVKYVVTEINYDNQRITPVKITAKLVEETEWIAQHTMIINAECHDHVEKAREALRERIKEKEAEIAALKKVIDAQSKSVTHYIQENNRLTAILNGIDKEIIQHVKEEIAKVPGVMLEGEIKIEHIPAKKDEEKSESDMFWAQFKGKRFDDLTREESMVKCWEDGLQARRKELINEPVKEPERIGNVMILVKPETTEKTCKTCQYEKDNVLDCIKRGCHPFRPELKWEPKTCKTCRNSVHILTHYVCTKPQGCNTYENWEPK